MAFETISTSLTSTYVIDPNDTVYVLAGAGVTSSGSAILGENDDPLYLVVDGWVVAASTSVTLGDLVTDTSALSVLVGETGVIRNVSSATGVFIQRTGSDITNHGEISGDYRGIMYSAGALTGSLDNTGLISARTSAAVYVSGAEASTSGTFDVYNSGTITGDTAAIHVRYQNLDVVNSGSLVGGYAVNLQSNNTSSNSLYLNNYGEIIGGVYAVFAANSDDIVINSGTMTGAIALNGGNDYFDGRGGSVSGIVAGGAGDDTYIIDDAGIQLQETGNPGVDTVQSYVGWKLGDNFENLDLLGEADLRGIGNAENNVINGNIGDNVLYGKVGNDTILGAVGDDFLSGQDGNDDLNGGDGNDVMRGGKGHDDMVGGFGDDDMRGGRGHDDISGGDGDDVLIGGGGNDILSGGDDNDILVGGTGTDMLTGGAGEDTFVFSRASHSDTLANADHITDFVIGEDLIDLSGFAGTLSFIGSGLYSNTAGEVRVATVGADSRVRIDVDGDGATDVNIVIEGVTGLTALDFLL